MQFSFEKRYFTGTYFYQIAVILLIHIVKHIASVISALSLVQHTETNIAKRLLGCVILTVYLCFIMLNVFNSQQVATGRSRAAHRRVIIYVHPYAHLFTLEDRVSSTIMSVYLCFIMLNFVRFTAGSCRSVAGHASVCDYLCESICSSFYTRGSGEFHDYVCLFMFYHAKHVQFTAGSHRSVAGCLSALDYLCESVCSSFHARGSGEFRDYVC